MRITKFGHSCLLVEESGARILIDPGMYSSGHIALERIDAILITHEHPDHCDLESLNIILSKNPSVTIYTNSGVGEKLMGAGLAFSLLENGQSATVRSVLVEGFGQDHARIYQTIPIIRNTGYMIAGRFFYPGDSVTNMPSKPVEILALPVVAPWMRLAEAIDFALQICPKVSFPVHDGFLKIPGPFHALPAKIFGEQGIECVTLEPGKAMEF